MRAPVSASRLIVLRLPVAALVDCSSPCSGWALLKLGTAGRVSRRDVWASSVGIMVSTWPRATMMT